MTAAHVGLVGPGTEGAAAVVEDAGGSATAGDAGDVLAAGVDAVAALGERALYALVSAGLSERTPALAVDAGDGVPGASAADRDRALRRLVAGTYRERRYPTLDVTARGERYRALADVMVTTAEPARISEYELDAVGIPGDAAIDSVRADGVVVATPAGSRGYGRTADGPVVSSTVDAVAVVPIAPFRLECSNWVVDPPVTLTVARDETPVSLLVDDRDVGGVAVGEPVEVARGDPVTLAVATGADRPVE